MIFYHNRNQPTVLIVPLRFLFFHFEFTYFWSPAVDTVSFVVIDGEKYRLGDLECVVQQGLCKVAEAYEISSGRTWKLNVGPRKL